MPLLALHCHVRTCACVNGRSSWTVTLNARRYAVHVPDNLPLDAAAPLLCAGITVYSPMMHYGLNKPGMKLGVVGLGGLGHMAVKFGKVRSINSAALMNFVINIKEWAGVQIDQYGAPSFRLGSPKTRCA